MKHLVTVLWYIFSVGAIPVVQNYTTETVSSGNVSENQNISALSVNSSRYMTPQLQMLTQCETPNNDPGYCIEIKMCPNLLRQLKNRQAWNFLRASSCGPSNQNYKNPKVCCGIHNFRSVSKNIVEDDILPISCGHQKMFIGTRVVGGRETSLQEYPWMALLLHRNHNGTTTLGCAGFLVHTKYVITAAHCTHPSYIKHKGEMVSVVLGEHNTQTSTDCSPYGFVCGKTTQIRKIARVTTHPDYDPTNIGHYNDIAIIRLKEHALLTDYVQPICLVNDGTITPTSYYVSGWGRTDSGRSSKVKMHVEIPPFDKANCSELFNRTDIVLRDTQICAGGEELSDTCSGDSGGPLMAVNKDGTWSAVGVVSFGVGCGVSGWPGVYTNIVKFLPWIKLEIAQEPR